MDPDINPASRVNEPNRSLPIQIRFRLFPAPSQPPPPRAIGPRRRPRRGQLGSQGCRSLPPWQPAAPASATSSEGRAAAYLRLLGSLRGRRPPPGQPVPRPLAAAEPRRRLHSSRLQRSPAGYTAEEAAHVPMLGGGGAVSCIGATRSVVSMEPTPKLVLFGT
ncbi:hypothetical protein BS78_06G059500 [Paspalum vaginatum]|nr:hypothetical protein BS78_06G059500 [Paspalum vaginatum]